MQAVKQAYTLIGLGTFGFVGTCNAINTGLAAKHAYKTVDRDSDRDMTDCLLGIGLFTSAGMLKTVVYSHLWFLPAAGCLFWRYHGREWGHVFVNAEVAREHASMKQRPILERYLCPLPSRDRTW